MEGEMSDLTVNLLLVGGLLLGLTIKIFIAPRLAQRIPWLAQPKPKRGILFEPREQPVHRAMRHADAPAPHAMQTMQQPQRAMSDALDFSTPMQSDMQSVKLSTIAGADNVLIVGNKFDGKTT